MTYLVDKASSIFFQPLHNATKTFHLIENSFKNAE